MADVYANFAALAAANTLGVDYEIQSRPVDSNRLAHIAIHGGAIEPATSQLAAYCAGSDGGYYTFMGIKSSGNDALRISSPNFDEPRGVALVAASAFTVSWHGSAETTPVTHVGGADQYSANLIRQELTAAGFRCTTSVTSETATSSTSITNRNQRSAGVHLELSLAQRQAMFLNGDLSLTSIINPGNRTQSFYAYCDALVRAMATATAPPAPVVRDPAALRGRLTARTDGPVQMAVPFSLAADGSIAVVGDEAQAVSDRVRALVGTLPGERVMRYDYGVPTHEALFAPDAATAAAEVQLMVTDAVAAFEPSAVLTSIQPTIDMDLGLVDVAVQVGRSDVPQDEQPKYTTVTVAVGGQVSRT